MSRRRVTDSGFAGGGAQGPQSHSRYIISPHRSRRRAPGPIPVWSCRAPLLRSPGPRIPYSIYIILFLPHRSRRRVPNKTGLDEWWRMNECTRMIVLCEWLLKIINIKKSGIMPPNLYECLGPFQSEVVGLPSWGAQGPISHNRYIISPHRSQRRAPGPIPAWSCRAP
jgi:hypothetical protein